METNENVVTKDYSASSDQNEIKMNVYDNNKLVEKQAKEFEELCLNKFKVENVSFEIEKIYKRYNEKINSQSKLIDGLRARIEELEVDSLIKNQEIKKIQEEFNFIKKEIQSTLAAPTRDNKENVSSIKDETIKDLGILESNYNSIGHYEKKTSSNCTIEKEQRKSSTFDIYDIYGKIQNEDNSRVVASSNYKLPLISMVNIFIKNRQVHSKVIATINNFKSKNKIINGKAFYHLFDDFTINDLLEYEKSILFYSLDDESRSCFKNTLIIR
ncbi:hypothetical protein RhiirC2_813684 [Rhizophagus irregularis]|uniref:Uncharacterized protein n=1 Tax=Rhizophagus irregularis TaxID=588596 RepID=A0A2N1MMP6_9GLOM|nr:hypothetical protein RhiirC2_813684 [Rhizophagus irregularis]